MTVQEVHERLQGEFGDAVGPLGEPKVDPFCVVRAARIADVCRFAKEDPALGMDFLEDLTALDWPKRNVIEVVYHLFSYRHRHAIVLKVEADRAAPRVPSVEGVWRAATWFEREVYDLFGVEFAGHSDLRRILLPDDWIGHPLRKDYQEAGGYRGFDNVRENPLVELRRLDERARAAAAAAAPVTLPAPAATTPPAPPAAPTTPAPGEKA